MKTTESPQPYSIGLTASEAATRLIHADVPCSCCGTQTCRIASTKYLTRIFCCCLSDVAVGRMWCCITCVLHEFQFKCVLASVNAAQLREWYAEKADGALCGAPNPSPRFAVSYQGLCYSQPDVARMLTLSGDAHAEEEGKGEREHVNPLMRGYTHHPLHRKKAAIINVYSWAAHREKRIHVNHNASQAAGLA